MRESVSLHWQSKGDNSVITVLCLQAMHAERGQMCAAVGRPSVVGCLSRWAAYKIVTVDRHTIRRYLKCFSNCGFFYQTPEDSYLYNYENLTYMIVTDETKIRQTQKFARNFRSINTWIILECGETDVGEGLAQIRGCLTVGPEQCMLGPFQNSYAICIYKGRK